MSDRKKLILDTVGDLVKGLFYYGRKEDEELPIGEIERAIESGEVNVEEIVKAFEDPVREYVKNWSMMLRTRNIQR